MKGRSMMLKNKEIGNAGRVSLTVLVDNKADLIVESNEHVRYFEEKPLLAEHGFSVLIQLDDLEKKILWDAGVSNDTLAENMRRMKLDARVISKIALSHGHSDHFAGMTTILKAMDLRLEEKEWGKDVSQDDIKQWMAETRIPLVFHPAALRERWWRKQDGNLVGPELPPPVREWEAAGATLVPSEKPYKLAEGCWTTGYIPRRSFEKFGRPSQLLYRNGSEFLPDDLEDDQAIVIHLKDKGLVVLSGCAHSGIVNTVRYAKEFTGIGAVHAVIGGFHLSGASDEDITKTIESIREEKPAYVIPSHCTGFHAMSRFAMEMPEEFIEGVVGATYIL